MILTARRKVRHYQDVSFFSACLLDVIFRYFGGEASWNSRKWKAIIEIERYENGK